MSEKQTDRNDTVVVIIIALIALIVFLYALSHVGQ